MASPSLDSAMRLSLRTFLILLALWFFFGKLVFGHELGGDADPELFSGWLTWLHLGIQGVHLVAFALWLGLTAGSFLFGFQPSLDQALYGSWVLLLVLLATGSYNMEWSAGISETPSLLLLPLLGRVPFGVTYTLVLWFKIALYGLAVVLTLVVTCLHVWRRADEARLRSAFLRWASLLGLTLTLAASAVLFYHEAADLWPTNVHSLGGVVGLEAPQTSAVPSEALLPPNNFALLARPAAWIDIGLRWLHLLGFGLWFGGNCWGLALGGVSARRFVFGSWSLLSLQLLTGVASMTRWTPFAVAPYLWNLHVLSHLRFGRTYTLFMGAKHALALLTVIVVGYATVRYLRSGRLQRGHLVATPYLVWNAILGLLIAFLMMAVLLLHEGVDHAL